VICCLCITLSKYFISFILPFQSGYKKHNILNIRVNLKAATGVFISLSKGLQKSVNKGRQKKKTKQKNVVVIVNRIPMVTGTKAGDIVLVST